MPPSRLTKALFLPLTLGLVACGRIGTGAPVTTGLDLSGMNAALPRIAPPPAAGQAVLGEAIFRFREGQEAPETIPGAVRLRPVAGTSHAWIYKLTSGAYTQVIADKWAADDRISFAEPVYLYHASGYPSGEDTTLYGLNRIEAPRAWDRTTGRSSITVAIVDTGVDYTHPDLEGVVIKGHDFVNNDDDPMDDHGHGTHCAGTVGAAANGRGIVGVAHGVAILAVKVLSKRGSGTNEQIAAGIRYAVDHGARVISMSLGGPDSQTTREAVQEATAKGVLCVVAAGNANSTTPEYPGALKESLCVGSSDSNDKRSSFSNFGAYVDIVAPGSDIYSLGLNGGYRKMSGTSMATPHVAGAAGLLLSRHPELSLTQLREALESSGDAVSGFSKTPDARRLNVAEALDRSDALLTTPPAADPDAPKPGPAPAIKGLKASTRSSTATLKWTTTLPARCVIEYGDTDDYGDRIEVSEGFQTSHSVTLTGLVWHHTYHYRIVAVTEENGQAATKDKSFLTRALGILSLANDEAE